MSEVPNSCPMCGSVENWKKVDESQSGFSAGKAAIGMLIAGPVGLIGGALGKKTIHYACGKCGFQHAYQLTQKLTNPFS